MSETIHLEQVAIKMFKGSINVLRIRDLALILIFKSRHKAHCAISFIRCYVLGGLSARNLI